MLRLASVGSQPISLLEHDDHDGGVGEVRLLLVGAERLERLDPLRRHAPRVVAPFLPARLLRGCRASSPDRRRRRTSTAAGSPPTARCRQRGSPSPPRLTAPARSRTHAPCVGDASARETPPNGGASRPRGDARTPAEREAQARAHPTVVPETLRYNPAATAHSSSGLGHRPLTAAARVRIPYGPSSASPWKNRKAPLRRGFLRLCRGVAHLRACVHPCHGCRESAPRDPPVIPRAAAVIVVSFQGAIESPGWRTSRTRISRTCS